jgi:hypothetical protein
MNNPALVEVLGALGATEQADSPIQVLARAISPSPVVVDRQILETCRAVSPAGIIELVAFISVLAMLHRLSSFYPTTTTAERWMA